MRLAFNRELLLPLGGGGPFRDPLQVLCQFMNSNSTADDLHFGLDDGRQEIVERLENECRLDLFLERYLILERQVSKSIHV